MARYVKIAYLLFVCATCLLFVLANHAHAQIISAPTIIEVSGHKSGKPFITGLIPAGTEALVYIDGAYAGLANINQEGSETDNFYYKHKIALTEGKHKIIVIARDKISLTLSLPSKKIEFAVPVLSAPTMIKPNEHTVTGKVKPLIKGLTISGTFVRVYIDGVYNGKTNILTHKSGTANFAYKPFLNLKKGWHTAWAITEDEFGRKSKPSNVLNFKIEEPMPAPTIFTPIVNNKTAYNHPFIVGLAKNNSLIKVFIDHKLDSEFKATNHDSGTISFAHLPYQPLTKGRHVLYTTATDSRGKESCWSNIIYFTVKQSDITQIDLKEKTETVAKNKKSELAKEESVAIIYSKEGVAEKTDQEENAHKSKTALIEKEVIDDIQTRKETSEESEKISDEDIKQLMKEEIGEEKTDVGLVDENKQRQDNLHLRLIIFIIFLLGVIAWICWVNRELIKERQIQDKKQKDKKHKDAEKNSSKDISSPPTQKQPPLI